MHKAAIPPRPAFIFAFASFDKRAEERVAETEHHEQSLATKPYVDIPSRPVLTFTFYGFDRVCKGVKQSFVSELHIAEKAYF